MPGIRQEWQITFCHPKAWRLIPRWHAHRATWPRVYQFHWLFLYAHLVEKPGDA